MTGEAVHAQTVRKVARRVRTDCNDIATTARFRV
jgi:hypothetical protein